MAQVCFIPDLGLGVGSQTFGYIYVPQCKLGITDQFCFKCYMVCHLNTYESLWSSKTFLVLSVTVSQEILRHKTQLHEYTNKLSVYTAHGDLLFL